MDAPSTQGLPPVATGREAAVLDVDDHPTHARP
jgi:hypothetical protein